MSAPRDTAVVHVHWNRLARTYDCREALIERWIAPLRKRVWARWMYRRTVQNVRDAGLKITRMAGPLWLTMGILARRGVLPAALAALVWLIAVPAWGSPAAPAGRLIHIVAPGDTLWSIASRHNTSVEALASKNRLTSIHRLQVGDRLVLPPRPPAGSDRIPPADRHVTVADPRRAVLPAIRPGFGWPSRGVITSRFGFRARRHHYGIDIAAPVGTPIVAATDGVVTFAGWMGGYGRLIILDHGAGLATWYGHASTLIATEGQRVPRGQLVARVGTSGRVTGPNLHFEVRRNGTPLDPLLFLRKGVR